MTPFPRTWIVLAVAMATPSFAGLQSRATQGVENDGQVQITKVAVRATIEQAWADIEEEVELQPIRPRFPLDGANSNSWEIYGDFALPKGAVLTGALLWDGERILKAKLKPQTVAAAQYEEVVARNTAPNPQPRDPLIIERASQVDSVYSLKLFPVSWKTARKMRLRYLVPLASRDGKWEIPLGSAFATRFSAVVVPDSFGFDWTCKSGSVKLRSPAGTPLPADTGSMRIPLSGGENEPFNSPIFNASMSAVLPFAGSIALTTQFDTSAWKGGYLVFQGRLPDSLLDQVNLRQEVVVLWRWSRRAPLNAMNGILDGARTLSSSLSSIARGSNQVKVGLVVDESPSSLKKFPLCKWGSEPFAQMQGYLESLTRDEISRKAAESIGASSGAVSSSQFRITGAREFVVNLKVAFSMYSKDTGVVRHLVVATAGPAEDFPVTSEALPDWPLGLTLSTWDSYNYGHLDEAIPESWRPHGHWDGVDLQRLEREHGIPAERLIRNWLPFATPSNSMAMSLEFESGSKTYGVITSTGTESGNRRGVSAAFHAPVSWKQRATWKAYAQDGSLRLSQPNNDIQWIDLPSDTAVAMLWGKADGHWSETLNFQEVGSVLGFVDRWHSLLALPSDTLGKIGTDTYRDRGVPFLLPSEIYGAPALADPDPGTPDPDPNGTPILQAGKGTRSFDVRLVGDRILRICLPGLMAADAELIIRDLRGKVVARWSSSQLMGAESLEWRISPSLGRSTLTVELRSGSERLTRSMVVL